MSLVGILEKREKGILRMSCNFTITESDAPLIAKLPVDQQDALRIGDHPYKVYADILGIKIGTLKSRVNRARNALKQLRILRTE